jgi:hypothetical protein
MIHPKLGIWQTLSDLVSIEMSLPLSWIANAQLTGYTSYFCLADCSEFGWWKIALK